MQKQLLRTYMILTLPFFFGWLLSFPFYGPVLYQAAPELTVKGISLVLIFIFFHVMAFILGGLLLKKTDRWYHILLCSLVVTLAANLALALPYPQLWPLVMIVFGVSSSLYILGWSSFFSLGLHIKGRIKIMAAVIILSNLVFFLLNLLVKVLPLNVVVLAPCIPLIIALVVLLRFPFPPAQVLQRPTLSLQLPNPLLLILSLFIFILYINGGFMYRIMLPALKVDVPFYSYYRFFLYILVLMVIYLYHKQIKRHIFLYTGVSLLGLAFVSFALLGQGTAGLLITSGLVEAAFALLDLFFWITVGSLSFIYGAPFAFFGFTMAATTGSIFLGDLIANQLLHIGETHRLVTAIFAAANIFLAVTVMPWLNQRIDENLSRVLQKEGESTSSPEEISLDRLTRYLLPGETLTPREKEIALLILQGLTNKDIARQLFISENTVKTHLKNIYQKFGVTKKKDLLYLFARKEEE